MQIATLAVLAAPHSDFLRQASLSWDPGLRPEVARLLKPYHQLLTGFELNDPVGHLLGTRVVQEFGYAQPAQVQLARFIQFSGADHFQLQAVRLVNRLIGSFGTGSACSELMTIIDWAYPAAHATIMRALPNQTSTTCLMRIRRALPDVATPGRVFLGTPPFAAYRILGNLERAAKGMTPRL